MNKSNAPVSQQDTASQVVTYADLIINYLLQINVEYVFGIPGGAIEPLYNALARNRDGKCDAHFLESENSVIPLRNRGKNKRLTAIIARHETAAAFMAEGYARETGRLAVCCSTTGPGATNLITGVATAYANRVPMLVITPQTALPDFGKLGFQESSSEAVDVVGMFEHCTRYNTLVSHVNQLESKLYTALVHAYRRPCGPVHVSIPMDILKAPLDNFESSYQVAHLFRQPKVLEEQSYKTLKSLLSKAKKNVIFLGGGARSSVEAILSYAERTNTPVVTTPTGKAIVNAYHPLYKGVFGFAGHPSAFDTIMEPDLDHIIAVGTSLSELSTAGWADIVLNNKLIHISNVPEDFLRSRMACLHMLGDPKTIFANLYKDLLITSDFRESAGMSSNMRRKTKDSVLSDDYVPKNLELKKPELLHSDAVPIKPQRVMYELASRMPTDARFIIDVGNAWSWATHYLMLDSTLMQRTDFGFGAMGWAIGAAVGTALGCKGKPVVCITGDGSYLMSGQEISVAVAHKLPVLFIVLNDQALGMIKHGQRLSGAENIGNELPETDFAMIARAQGADGISIKEPKDFDQIDPQKIFSLDRPTLIDVRIDPEEVPPMGVRIKTLNK